MIIWKEILYGIVRSIVAAAAGYVFSWMQSKGMITGEQSAIATVSAVAFVWALVWSAWQKLRTKYKLDIARFLSPDEATNEAVHEAAKQASVGEIVSAALKEP